MSDFKDISDRLVPELKLDAYERVVIYRLHRLRRGRTRRRWRDCRHKRGSILRFNRSVLLIIVAATMAFAQDAATVEQQAERLRAQLREVTDKESQLQAREQQLDEELKPENVERSVAAIGTTDARALREQRQQQLEREKANVEEQLRSLAASRTSLEASIARAEAEAVRQRASALGANNAPTQTEAASTPTAPAAQKPKSGARTSKRRKRVRARRRVSSH